MAPLFGVVGASVGLSCETTTSAMGFCVSRDIVSAAVRLNLIGPMAAVSLLARARRADASGQAAARASMASVADGEGRAQIDLLLDWCMVAAGSAPALEAMHPGHDKLAMRLFQT